MDVRELLARIIVAEEGCFHNDPPLFDDYGEQERAMYLHRAQWLMNTLQENGYEIVPLNRHQIEGAER